MYYYKKNIGDYHKKAGRLSMLQHGAYTLLIDSCYDREVFPSLDDAISWTWASSTGEIEAVEFVLKRFFTLEDGVYTQKHIKEDLEKYHKNSEINKRIALDREAKRRENSTKRTQPVDEATPNQEPRTINQEPLTIIKTKVSAEPKPSKYKFEDIDLDFSKQMYQRILELNATYKEPNYEAWANAIRLARDQDKRSIDDLWDVFDWANKDSFWQANILSPKKLRDKFDDLVIKMNSAKNSPPPIQSAGQGNTDWAENIGQPYLPNEPKQGLIDHD